VNGRSAGETNAVAGLPKSGDDAGMPIADASGVPIHYELAGSGPPLVLLHGWIGDSTTWRHAGYVDALADWFTLVLIDGRGRGRSGKPHDPAMYATHHLAGDVIAVLDHLGVDRAGYWGQSLGGRVGLVLAIRHPGRLRALVAGATRAQAVTVNPATIDAEVRSIREQGMAGVVADLEAAGALPEWLRSVILAADPTAVAASYAAMLDWPGMMKELADLQVPTLVLAGERDPGLGDLRATATQIPGARLAVLPGCGHLETFIRGDLALPVVLPFLTEVLTETPI
jgi:pimeloyl-ACP methyl ester carboxylesterase